jgi:hypothetical protein
LLTYGGLFSLEREVNDSVFQYKEELTLNYGEKLKIVTNIERYPFAYLPLLKRDAILSQHFQWDLQTPNPIDKHEGSTDNGIVNCSGIESFSAIGPSTVYSPVEKVKSRNENFAQPTLCTPKFSYSYRFTDTVFSWENPHSLTHIKKEDSLIPTALLDAILKSNFELFFLQKKVPDEELHAVYLNILHGTPDHTIAKASTTEFTNLTTLLLLFLVVYFFIHKYLKVSQTNPINIEAHTLRSEKKTKKFTRK